MDQEIVDYILQAQRHGLQDMEIKQNLLNAGWDANAVEQSFIFAKAADTHSSPGTIVPGGMPRQTAPAQAAQEIKPQSQPMSMPTAQSSITISDQHFNQPAAKKSFFKKPVFWIILLVLLVLAGSAYGYYTLVLGNPTKVWEKFSQGGADRVYQTKFNFNYSDPGSYDGGGSGFQLKDIKLSLNGDGYINASNQDNPESSSTVQYTFGSGNTSFSTGFQYILQNKNLYLNVGQNPILDALSQEMNGGQKIDWIKIDLTLLENQASTSPAEEARFFMDIAAPDFKAQIQKIWDNATIIKEDKFVGRENINGTQTLHFQNSVDKEALKGMINQYVRAFTGKMKDDGAKIQDSDVQTVNELAAQLIDKIQIQDLETWIGMTDFKLYRVRLAANAPSVISFAKNAQNFSLPQGNDAKRLSDIRQMASALELYYNDHNGYPDGKNGQPAGVSPAYIALVPTAPSADGDCNNFYNTYWYQPMGNKRVVSGATVYDSYQMTFCLGSDTGGYKAGIGKLSPSGISDNIVCPGSPEHCAKPASSAATDINEAIRQKVTDFVGKLDFSAQITADADYSKYGLKVMVAPPANYFDVIQKYLQTQTPMAQQAAIQPGQSAKQK